MESNTQNKKFNKYFRLIIIPFVFTGFYILAFLIDPYRHWSGFFNRPADRIVREILFVLTLCLMITGISLYIAKKLDLILPWVQRPVTRFISQFSLQIIATALFFFFYMKASDFVFGAKFSELDKLAVRQAFAVSILLSVLISLAFTGKSFFQKWKDALMETAQLNLNAVELKQIALEAQLQSLKVQLDPHFMFNNFSTLSALIAEDQSLAQHFLENLSRVYRYMIVNLNKNIISVEEEINFAKAYFYLIKIRHGENVQLTISVGNISCTKGIPPITLQLLIENSIKHNTASRTKPLFITIEEGTNDDIVVSNSLQRLNYTIPSTNTGLKNVKCRYKLLSDRVPEFTETENQFVAKLPLLSICSKIPC